MALGYVQGYRDVGAFFLSQRTTVHHPTPREPATFSWMIKVVLSQGAQSPARRAVLKTNSHNSTAQKLETQHYLVELRTTSWKTGCVSWCDKMRGHVQSEKEAKNVLDLTE